MNFQSAINSGFKNWIKGSWRSSRSEYWWFQLFIFIVSFAASLADDLVDLRLFSTIVTIVMFIPNLSLSIRRLHDIDKKGSWIFIALIPIIGWIVLLIWFCTKGTNGPNRFGADPLQTSVA